MTTTPNLKRENTLKVPMNDPETAEVRQFCARIGKSVAPFVRDLTLAHIRAELNRTVQKQKSEWPRRGHVQRFPGRLAGAGGCRHLRL